MDYEIQLIKCLGSERLVVEINQNALRIWRALMNTCGHAFECPQVVNTHDGVSYCLDIRNN